MHIMHAKHHLVYLERDRVHDGAS